MKMSRMTVSPLVNDRQPGKASPGANLWKVMMAIVLFTGAPLSHADCPIDPLPQATDGYGANGPHTQSVDAFTNAESSSETVYVYRASMGSAAPTIFFSHAWGARDPAAYAGMIEHLNSLGYTVVYAQYPTLGASMSQRYAILWGGFKEAASRYPQYIDTSQVAFFGHSLGGGATPRMTLNGINEGWGNGGVSMYIMAPWYALELTDDDLSNFPTDVKMVMMVMQDDPTNDHEMALDVYHNIAISQTNKAYYILQGDTQDDCILVADHAMPLEGGQNGELDGLDYWNWYHMDALVDYAFTGNRTAQDIALGGSEAQTYWGTWWTATDYQPINVSLDPLPSNPQSAYQFPCSDNANPRAYACGTRRDPEHLGSVEILAGLGYDRAHDGHGFDLHKAGEKWALFFYSYNQAGDPEWYLGLGEMHHETIAGDFSLFRYDPADDPPQTPDPGFSGRFFLDFSSAASARACADGIPRDNAIQKALFEWRIGEESGTWCTEYLRFGAKMGNDPYLGGVWYAGEQDTGYGATMAHMDDMLATIVYYYDNQGSPRWALGVGDENEPLIDLNHFSGFCRSCDPLPLAITPAGTLELAWEAGAMPGSGGDTAELLLDYPLPPGGRFDRSFTLHRLSDGVSSVTRQPYVYMQPSPEFCLASEVAEYGFLCAVQPSALDAATRDIYATGSLPDERLGFGYHVVAFPQNGTEINGVYLHLTGSYGRPYNQRNGEFANRLFLKEALEAGYITIQLAYNNRFAVNLDECGGNAERLAVDNCAGDVRLEKITGEDISDVTDTPRADSIEHRLLTLFEYLESQGVDFPYALTDGERINWSRLRVGGHSQGATHAMYLYKYFDAAHACVLAGGYDVPDSVPDVPPEGVADWLLDGSVPVDLSAIRAVVSVDDSSYDAFVAAYALLGMEKGVHWQDFNGAPYQDSDGEEISGHSAAVKDSRFKDLRIQACFL